MKNTLLIFFLIFSLAAGAQTLQPGTSVVPGFEVSGIAHYQNNLFICGMFDSVGSIYVPDLAMLYADTGTLQSWRPAPNGAVNAVLVQNGKLIVAGDFTMIAGQPRNYIAVFDAATGALSSVAPSSNLAVTALWADNNNIYFNYTSPGGITDIKYFDLNTGALSGWSSNPFASGGSVNTIAKAGNYVYVGGDDLYPNINSSIMDLMRYSTLTGRIDTTFVLPPSQANQSLWISQILPYNGNIYVCGSFDSLGNYPAYGFLALDSTGLPTNFNFNPTGGQTLSMFPQGNTLWVGGNSFSFGYTNNSPYLAQIDLATGIATCWDHPLSGNWDMTDAIYVSNDTVWAGCIDANNNFNMYVGNPYSVTLPSITISTVSGYPLPGIDSLSTPYILGASYQWYVNGYAMYNNDAPSIGLHGDFNGDSIWVIVRIYTCNGQSTINDTSNIVHIVMPPPPPPPPSVLIEDFNGYICQGENDVTIYAGISDQIGNQISYQWYRNGLAVGTNSSWYTPMNIQNGDKIWVVAVDSSYTLISDTLVISAFQMPPLNLSVSGTCSGPDTIDLLGYSPSLPIYWMRNNIIIDTVVINQLICPFPQSAYNLGAVSDMTIDRYGAVYVSGDSNRVIKWAPGDSIGVVVAGDPSGIAGSGPSYLNNPTGIFVDSNRNLYICDELNNRIQRWDYGATQGVTVAGGNGAGSAANQLNSPFRVYVDNAANVYITDFFNYRVQKWFQGATAGITVAGGNGAVIGAFPNNSQLIEPTGLAVDNSGNVYVGDSYWGSIYRWSPGDITGTFITGDQLDNTALAIQFDNNGNLLIGDSSGLVSWDISNSRGTTLISGNTENFQPALEGGLDFHMDNSGCIYVLQVSPNLNVSINILQGVVTKWCGIDTSLITDQPGTYRAMMTYTYGCADTSAAVTISTNTVTATHTQICPGGSYTFAGHMLTQPGIYSDTLAASGGCDSIVTLALSLSSGIQSSRSAAICPGSSYSFGGHTLTQAGSYTDTLISSSGCDSVVILNLTVTSPVASTITRNGNVLTDNATAPHYQWLLNGINIPGDTTASITISANGSYSVDVTDANGCTKMSDTVQVINVGVQDISSIEAVSIHPNPATESCTITIAGGNGSYSVVLTDMTGKEVGRPESFTGTIFTLPVSPYAKGVYLLKVMDSQGASSVNKLIIE